MSEQTATLPKVQRVKLTDLVPWEKNPRAHGAEDVRYLKESLARFGEAQLLCVQKDTMRVIGGNGRLQAMRELGWTHARCIILDIDDLAADELGIRLNRSAELSAWEPTNLQAILDNLQANDVDVDALGWTGKELDEILKSAGEVTTEPEAAVADNGEPYDGPPMARPIAVTTEEWEAISRVVDKFRVKEDAADARVGRIVELIFADWDSRN